MHKLMIRRCAYAPLLAPGFEIFIIKFSILLISNLGPPEPVEDMLPPETERGTFFLNIMILYIYIYIYMRVCVCVCV